ADVIEHHHDFRGSRRDPFLTAIVAAADYFCDARGVSTDGHVKRIDALDMASLLRTTLPSLTVPQMDSLASALEADYLLWAQWTTPLTTASRRSDRGIGGGKI